MKKERAGRNNIMYLVFDVGGTFTKCALVNEQNEIVEKSKTPTITDSKLGTEAFVEGIGRIYDGYKAKGMDISGIAMSLPGQIDVEQGIVYGGGALMYLDKVALGPLISKRCDYKRVAMENDGKCAALAEVWKGNGKDCQDICVFVFGTGIGGGIIKNRKIHRGRHLCAGELSYMIGDISRNQLDTICDANKVDNIWDVWDKMPYLWCSQAATASRCLSLARQMGKDMSEISGELMYELAEKGDENARNLLEDWYLNIAKQCCSMQAIYDPEVILIGGGISANPKFIEGIRRYAGKLMEITEIFSHMEIETCKFLNDSNILGALFNYKQIYEGLV